MFDLIIRNGVIYDGTGEEAYRADIGVKDGKIAVIGNLKDELATEEIDADGQQVTPGFFDMHSHADLSIVQYPDAEGLLGQGITTVFCGHCGMGMAPVGKYWKTQGDDLFAVEDFNPLHSVGTIPGRTAVCQTEQMRAAYEKYFGVKMDWTTFGEYCNKLRLQGVGVNLAMEVGLQQIRQQVLGLDFERAATEAEICQMEELVVEAMEAGAFGLSIGYDYTPDLYASEEELDRLARVVKRYDGIVAAHTRNAKDGDMTWQPIDGMREFLDMGKRTGAKMHISHVQPGFKITPQDRKLIAESGNRTVEVFEEYRKQGVSVTWDVLVSKSSAFYYYPQLCSPLIYYILECGGKAEFRERLQQDDYKNRICAAMKSSEHIIFPRFDYTIPVLQCSNKEYEGKTILELAEERNLEPEETVLQILKEDVDTFVRPVLPFERLKDEKGFIDTFYPFWKRDDASIGTDNCAFNYDYEGHLPNLPVYRSTMTSYSGFVTFLLESENERISFERTIRKLTGNAADYLGITNRGYLKEGQMADIVILDRTKLNANVNYLDPRQRPSGVEYVIVNGKIAVKHGVHTHARSGKVLDYRSDRN